MTPPIFGTMTISTSLAPVLSMTSMRAPRGRPRVTLEAMPRMPQASLLPPALLGAVFLGAAFFGPEAADLGAAFLAAPSPAGLAAGVFLTGAWAAFVLA